MRLVLALWILTTAACSDSLYSCERAANNYGALLNRAVDRQKDSAEDKAEKSKTAAELIVAVEATCERENWGVSARRCMTKAGNLAQLQKCPKPGQIE